MRCLLCLSFLLLNACDSFPEKYPGSQAYYERCHNLWQLDYKINVEACELHATNPKYKKGSVVKLYKLAENCEAVVLIPSWSGPQNQPMYFYKTKCGQYFLDTCEGMDCPIFSEKDVRD